MPFISKYIFERSELRVLQNTYNNEDFLNYVAESLGTLQEKLEAAERRAAITEDQVRKAEQQ